MNLHNPGEVGSRVSYYGINGAPTSRLDGTNVGEVTQGSLDARYAVSSPYTIALTHHISVNYDSIYIKMVITATSDMPSGLIAQIAVIEEHIHFNSPPGSNGETDFYNVMLKMLPNANGTTVPALNTGQTFTINTGWKLNYFYDIDDLAVVGFIQDNSNKDVKQTGYSAAVPVIPAHSYDAYIKKMVNEQDCNGNAKPTVTFVNFGSVPLTSLTIKYNINGGADHTYLWSTSTPLNFLEQTTVDLDTINFSDTNNLLTVYLTNPNGQPDQNPANDTAKTTFVKYRDLYRTIYLKMKMGSSGGTITWKILKPDGSIFTSGGPYNNNQPISKTIVLPSEGCYKFFIMDSEGNGLLPPGYYKITDSVHNVLVDSTSFVGYQKVHPFNVRYDAGIIENTVATNVSIFPNPFQKEAKITFNLEQSETVKISVFNILGRIVYNDDLGYLLEGNHQYTLPAYNLEAGIYFVKLNIGNKLVTKKIVIE